MKIHPAKRIVLKFVEVDEMIIKPVKWLNKIDNVTTLYSCQGGDHLGNITFVTSPDGSNLLQPILDKITLAFSNLFGPLKHPIFGPNEEYPFCGWFIAHFTDRIYVIYFEYALLVQAQKTGRLSKFGI